MENFIVSARKYRPTSFENVVGQNHVTTTLQNAIENNQLAQALLFCGPRGVGKTTCARILAKKVNDFDDQMTANSLNIFELDAASNNSVEDIRNLIDQVRYPPQQGKFKVYIIDEVHMLSNAAFNAFLKTLEEPPPYAIFILATTEKHKVIPTILSRCQIYDFNRIRIEEIVKHLKTVAAKEKIEAEEEALHLIAQKSDGALRDALSLFDLIATFSSDGNITYQSTIKNLHILDYDYYFKLTDALLEGDSAEVLLIFDEILQNGFDGHNLIIGLSEHFRNLLVCKDKETVKLLQSSESVQQRYLEQTKDASASFLLSALNISNKCDLGYKSSKNQRLHVELSLLKIAHLNSVLNLADTNSETETIKKKITEQKVDQRKPAGGKLDLKEEGEKTSSKEPAFENRRAKALPEKPGKLPNSKKEKSKLKTPRITGMRQAHEDLFESSNTTDVAEPVLLNEDFDEESLKNLWSNYAESVKKEGRENEFMVMSQSWELREDKTINLKLRSSLQEDILERFKRDLLEYLRAKLKNGRIKIETRINREDTGKMLYTASEKFKYLAGKNPNLIKLQSRMGLDTDF